MNRRLPPGKPQQGQPRRAPQTHGPIESVPCPHCGKRLDFRDLQSQQLLDTGHKIICDHCHRVVIVAALRQITLVALQPSNEASRHGLPSARPAQQATTIGPAALRKLLGGG